MMKELSMKHIDVQGIPTGGIGHLITEWDEEYYEQPIGTKIPNEQVDDWFAKDIETTIKDCNLLFSQFDNLPVIYNMY
jgi:hypothetical protein